MDYELKSKCNRHPSRCLFPPDDFNMRKDVLYMSLFHGLMSNENCPHSLALVLLCVCSLDELFTLLWFDGVAYSQLNEKRKLLLSLARVKELKEAHTMHTEILCGWKFI